MTEKPLISVIILTYNQEDTIARAIESVIAQRTDFPFEIIIGEDHSRDNTARICRSYADRYPGLIRLFENNPNKGLVDNYYDCVLASRGDFIADCAGDDFWIDEHKLQRQADILRADPSIVLVHTAWNNYNATDGTSTLCLPQGPAVQCRKPIADGREIIIPILTSHGTPVIHLSTALYRRDRFLSIYHSDTSLFRDKRYPCEDIQLIFTLCETGKVAYLPDPTINYSTSGPSVSSFENPAKTFDFYYGVTLLRQRLAERASVESALLRDYNRHILHHILALAFHTGDKERRRRALSLIPLLGIRPSAKSRAIILATAFRPIWNLARRLHPFRPC